MKRKLLPITLLCLLGLVACSNGGHNTEPGTTSQPETTQPGSSVAPETTTTQPTETETTPVETETTPAETTTTPVETPVVTTVAIANKEALTAEWEAKSADREIKVNINGEAVNVASLVREGKLKVETSNAEVVAIAGKYLKALKEGTATITVSVPDTDAVDKVELNILPEPGPEPITDNLTIAQIKAGIADGSIHASTGKSDEGTVVSTYARITATLDPKGDYYAGMPIADGNEAFYLYTGLDNWETQNMKIGDLIYAKGQVATYQGLYQIKPTEFRLADQEIDVNASKVAAPAAPIKITAENWNEDLVSSIVYAEDLEYVGGKVTLWEEGKKGKASFLQFKLGELPIKVHINYHNGLEQVTAIKSKIDKLNPGDKVTMYGACDIGGDDKTIALMPMFIEGKTPEQCITIPEVVAPTKLTISGENKVKATESITLTLAAEPENAAKAVTWTSSDPTIAEVVDGVVTGVKEGKVTIKATSTIDTTVSATYDVTVTKAPAKNREVPVVPVIGETYKIGVEMNNGHLFVDGGIKSERLTCVKTYAEGVAVTVEKAGENGYALRINGAKTQYIGLEPNADGYVKTVLKDTPFELAYDAKLNTFVKEITIEIKGTPTAATFAIGTYADSGYPNVEAKKLSPDKTYTLLHCFDYLANPEVVTAPVAGTYKWACESVKLEKTLFFAGTINGGGYFETTEDETKAADVVVEVVDTKFALKVGEKYIDMIPNGFSKSGNLKAKGALSDTQVLLDFNTEFNTFTKTLTAKNDKAEEKTGTFYIGTYGTFDTFSCSSISYAGSGENMASTLVTLIKKPAAISAVISGEKEVMIGSSIALNVKLNPTGASVLAGTWTTSDATKATVENGVVTGVAEGTVTITYTNGTVTATYEVTVKGAPSNLATDTLNCKAYPEGKKSGDAIGTIKIGANITMATDKGSASTAFRWYESKGHINARSYVGNTATFTAAEGYQIHSITFDCFSVEKDMTCENGKVSVVEKVITVTITDPTQPIVINMNKLTINSISVSYLPVAA